VKGSLAMVIAGEQRILMVGDTFRIPAGTAHGARVFEEITQVVQVFAPPRTDLPKPGSDVTPKA
jgi:mannose-6-phosphate isomerase-like protein (cupin superfamily)